jgi:hypothetical protein
MKVRWVAVAGAVVALGTAVAPAGASAAPTVSCRPGKYLLVDTTGGSFPVISRLRATGLPAKTDGYAPRCLVAEAVAAVVQQHSGKKGRYHVYGARWDGGWWKVSYRTASGSEVAKYTCRRGDQTVTFTGGS